MKRLLDPQTSVLQGPRERKCRASLVSFSNAASFAVLKLRVQECSTPAHIGEGVRKQNAARTRFQLAKVTSLRSFFQQRNSKSVAVGFCQTIEKAVLHCHLADRRGPFSMSEIVWFVIVGP